METARPHKKYLCGKLYACCTKVLLKNQARFVFKSDHGQKVLVATLSWQDTVCELTMEFKKAPRQVPMAGMHDENMSMARVLDCGSKSVAPEV